jgi:hypothetical protein
LFLPPLPAPQIELRELAAAERAAADAAAHRTRDLAEADAKQAFELTLAQVWGVQQIFRFLFFQIIIQCSEAFFISI